MAAGRRRRTIAEKILARASGRDEARPGDYVTAEIDLVMSHELLANVIERLAGTDFSSVWDRERIVVPLDHWAPAPNPGAAEIHKRIREFAREQEIKHFYDVGEGVCHLLLPERGHVRPGELIVGTDSHTTTYGALGAAGTGVGHTEMAYVLATGKLWFRVPETIRIEIEGELPEHVYSKDVMLMIAGELGTEVAQYKSIEYAGSAVEGMSVESRMVLSNMAVELGAKFGFCPVDDKVIGYVKARTDRPFEPVFADEGAEYAAVYQFDVSTLSPQVACPHSVDNVKDITEVEGLPIDQFFLGSCTNGKYEDLKIAAEILRGERVHPSSRMIIIPATKGVYRRALEEGLIELFLDAGALVANPGCGACFGGGMGVLAPGERCLATTNRNFKGRMGSPDSEVYLASPATVAASAVQGRIADPRRVD